uniref:Uncharacterized protein n=1 Tax=Glossina austeni TaxID=7395 RepID=A0A1A9UXS5_GLOAU
MSPTTAVTAAKSDNKNNNPINSNNLNNHLKTKVFTLNGLLACLPACLLAVTAAAAAAAAAAADSATAAFFTGLKEFLRLGTCKLKEKLSFNSKIISQKKSSSSVGSGRQCQPHSVNNIGYEQRIVMRTLMHTPAH